MSKEIWLQNVSIVVGLALGALLIFHALTSPQLVGQAESRAVEVTGEINSSKPHLPPCGEENERSVCDAHYYDRRDLIAQRSMSDAAWWSVALGIANLALLAGTLLFSIVATRAATEAARTARQELEVLERPYLRAIGVGFEPIEPDPETASFQYGYGANGSVKFENYGRAPAVLKRIHVTLALGLHFGEALQPVDPDTRGRELPFGSVVIPEKDSDEFWGTHRIGAEHFLPPDPEEWWLIGLVRYEDSFSNEFVMGFCFRRSRDTWVRSAPAGEPNERFNYSHRVERSKQAVGWRQRLAAMLSA